MGVSYFPASPKQLEDMQYIEYQEKALTTAKYPNVGSNFIYPALGLAGETGELAGVFLTYPISENTHPTTLQKFQTDITKELGDVMWYVAAAANEINITVDELSYAQFLPPQPNEFGYYLALVSSAGRVAEHAKKSQRDDNGQVTDARRTKIIESLREVMRNINGLCMALNIEIEDVMHRNIEKLFDRRERNVISGEGDNR
jgi:NTP pyrophosphatase (non-canonical NTP hydrolase)